MNGPSKLILLWLWCSSAIAFPDPYWWLFPPPQQCVNGCAANEVEAQLGTDHLVPNGGKAVDVKKNDPIRGGITAVFRPPYALSRVDAFGVEYERLSQAPLRDTARLLGFDHFNWLQVVTHTQYPMPLPNGKLSTVPYLDPPINGSFWRWADNQPYVYDEITPSPLPPKYQAGYNINDFTDIEVLRFEDQPSRPFLAGEFNHYVTHLVGVKSAINWQILDTFSWNTDYNNLTNTGEVDANRPSDFPDATGEVFGLEENIPLEDLPDSYRRFLVSLGADNIPLDAPVPEPTALSLFLIGWLSLLSSTRRVVA